MARFNAGFMVKYEAALDEKLQAAIGDLANTSACAGIKDNDAAAFRARVNHHGAFATKVPARPFIYESTLNIGDLKLGSEIRKIIKERISAPERERRYTVTDRYGAKRTQHDRMAAFGRGNGLQRTPNRIMTKLAEQMAANQRKIIQSRSYRRENDHGNDPAINQPRVVERKGFNFPMKDTGTTYAKIEAWTE